MLRRFAILVLARAGVQPEVCAWYLGCSIATVRKWSTEIEQAEELLDRSRAGARPLFDEAAQLRVVAFYCQSPLPGCRGWSLSSAADYLNKHLEIVGHSITPSTIHRILKRHSLRPHRVKYYLHISDPLFFPKMERLIQLYLSKPKYLFCFDECTGIQALERLGMPIEDDNGKRIESEYKRHGRTDLFAVLRVSTGEIFARTSDNHVQETITEFFSEHVQMQPRTEVLHYVCDNLAGHSTELFCRKVAELAGVPYPRLKTAADRRQWLQSRDKRIIFHFTPTHGSWLNMVEIWFAILYSRCLKGGSFPSVQALVDTILAFCETWNIHFAHPFNWRYRGLDLAQSVVRRLCEWILLESNLLKPKFLEKEILLMTNLTEDYWHQVSANRWRILRDLLLEKHDHLCRIHRQHAKAEGSLPGLVELLSDRLRHGPAGTPPGDVRRSLAIIPDCQYRSTNH